MTPDEMEAKINALNGQIEALQQRQDAQAKHWSQCAGVALIAVLPLALLTMAGGVLGIIAHRTDPITLVFGVAMTLTVFLSLAFQRAAAATRGSA